MAILQTTQAASASRKLILVRDGKEHKVLVEIGPISPVGQNASCHVRIAGEEQEFNQDIYGVDGIQATQLAMTFAGSTLDRIAERKAHILMKKAIRPITASAVSSDLTHCQKTAVLSND